MSTCLTCAGCCVTPFCRRAYARGAAYAAGCGAAGCLFGIRPLAFPSLIDISLMPALYPHVL